MSIENPVKTSIDEAPDYPGRCQQLLLRANQIIQCVYEDAHDAAHYSPLLASVMIEQDEIKGWARRRSLKAYWGEVQCDWREHTGQTASQCMRPVNHTGRHEVDFRNRSVEQMPQCQSHMPDMTSVLCHEPLDHRGSHQSQIASSHIAWENRDLPILNPNPGGYDREDSEDGLTRFLEAYRRLESLTPPPEPKPSVLDRVWRWITG